MKRYEPLIPRVAFGIAAVAMTAITITGTHRLTSIAG